MERQSPALRHKAKIDFTSFFKSNKESEDVMIFVDPPSPSISQTVNSDVEGQNISSSPSKDSEQSAISRDNSKVIQASASDTFGGRESPDLQRQSSTLGFRMPQKQWSRVGSRKDMSPVRTPSTHLDIKETRSMTKERDPATGNKMINQYMILRELGRGMHGKVKLAMDTKNNTFVAIKIVRKNEKKKLTGRSISNRKAVTQIDKIQKEIAILKKCHHPNIVALLEVIDDDAADKIYMVLEYLEGGEIKWRNEANNEPLLDIKSVRRIFRDLVSGVQYLHYQGIIHRDIKPANLLWTSDKRVKISDFGVSIFLGSQDHVEEPETEKKNLKEHSKTEFAKTAGSPAFFAPELCCVDEDNDEVPNNSGIPQDPLASGRAIDVWAVGVTLYCLVFGRLPYLADTEYELFRKISKDSIEYPSTPRVEDKLLDLFSKIFQKNPEKRIKLDDIRMHPWVVMEMKSQEKAKWLEDSNPEAQWERVEVTEEEVQGAVKFMSILKDSFRRLSSSFLNLAPAKKSSQIQSFSDQPSSPKSNSLRPNRHSFHYNTSRQDPPIFSSPYRQFTPELPVNFIASHDNTIMLPSSLPKNFVTTPHAIVLTKEPEEMASETNIDHASEEKRRVVEWETNYNL